MEAGMMGTNRSISLLLLIAAGTAGIATLFLPFIFDTSPVGMVLELFLISDAINWAWSLYALLAFPLFLPVLVSAASVRLMISGLFSRSERAVAYVASSMMAFSTLSFIILLFIVSGLPSFVHEWLASTIPVLTLVLGVFVVIKNLRNKRSKEVSAVMAMQVAYLSNALFCLILFFGGWQIGAYCVVVTSIIYLLQVVLASVKSGVFRRGGTENNVSAV